MELSALNGGSKNPRRFRSSENLRRLIWRKNMDKVVLEERKIILFLACVRINPKKKLLIIRPRGWLFCFMLCMRLFLLWNKIRLFRGGIKREKGKKIFVLFSFGKIRG